MAREQAAYILRIAGLHIFTDQQEAMVDVKILFEHNGKTWEHEFNVKKGATIANLKQVMLTPNGTKQDTDKFELRKNGRRVPNYVPIKRDAEYEFQYLGAEEGTRRAKEDEAAERQGVACWESDEEDIKAWTVCFGHDLAGKDVESMEASDVKAVKSRVELNGYSGFALWKGTAYLKKVDKQLTKKDLKFKGKDSGVTFYIYNPNPIQWQESEPGKPPEQHWAQEQQQATEPWKPPEQHWPWEQQAQPEPPKPAKPQKPPAHDVEVTVKHAMPELASEITVQVKSDCTVMDVRRAVMAALDERKLSEVKLVKRLGKHLASFTGSEPLGSRREFLSMGRRLQRAQEEPPPPSALAQSIGSPSAEGGAHASAPGEQRLDPNDGVAYTWEECLAKWRGHFRDEEVAEYWHRDMVVTSGAAATTDNSINSLEQPPAPAAQPPEEERRVDPSDGTTYTWAEYLAKWGGQFGDEEVAHYWATGMAVVSAPAESSGLADGWGPEEAAAAWPAPEEPAELDVTITIDRALGFSTQLRVPRDSSLSAVKQHLASTFEAGAFNPEDWLLGLPPGHGGEEPAPLPDDAPVNEERTQLDLIPKERVQVGPSGPGCAECGLQPAVHEGGPGFEGLFYCDRCMAAWSASG